MKIVVLFFATVFICQAAFSQGDYIPVHGYVPDQETAKTIAEAIWLTIYGKSILGEKPFKATLVGDSLWVVIGTAHSGKGGTAYIELRKKDCKVLKVTHGK